LENHAFFLDFMGNFMAVERKMAKSVATLFFAASAATGGRQD